MNSTFPQFNDGNVEIHLSSNKDDKLVLHSYVLALHSSWFKASLSERWNGGSAPSDANANRWVYELRFDKDSAFRLLTRKADPGQPASTDTKFIDSGVDMSGSPDNAKKLHQERIAKIKAHEQLLGTLYHLAPAFSHESFDTARASILRLTEVADAHGAQKVVKVHVESHLRFYKEEVLRLCSTEPIDMLELAMSAQSEWIFMEAATLVIGRSKYFFSTHTKRLTDLKILPLLQRKRRDLKETLKSCDFQLLLIASEPRETWEMDAVNYFRDYIAKQFKQGYGSGLRRGYAKTYRLIADRAASDTEYLDVTDFQQWLEMLYSEADAEVRREALAGVYRKAMAIVEPIMKDITRLQDNTVDEYKSLRFMGVRDDELPWVKKA